MKKCVKCEIDKDAGDFGIDKYKFDGLNSYCKACIRKRNAEQRKNQPEYYKKYAEEYREENRELLREKSRVSYYVDWEKRAEQNKRSYEKHREAIAEKRAIKRRTIEEKEKNRLRQAEWRKSNGTRGGEISAKWKKENPQKAACHSLILWAIRAGVLKRNERCEECNAECKTQGHHEDYSKPLEVRWLCKGCHAKKHRTYR